MAELLKEAILIPILKEPNLNTEVLNNYRPISNLPCLSKLIEKSVANQLTDYTTIHSLDEIMQSAYRPNPWNSVNANSVWYPLVTWQQRIRPSGLAWLVGGIWYH